MKPTMPLVSGGRPCSGSVRSARTVSRSTSTGLPSVGMPAGGVPSQWALPSRVVSVAGELVPMNE